MAKKLPDDVHYGDSSVREEIADLLKIMPGKITGRSPIETFPTTLPGIFPDANYEVDGMDMKEVIEFLMEEIDSLNKRVKELEQWK